MLSIDFRDKARFKLSAGTFLVITAFVLLFSSLLIGYEKIEGNEKDLDNAIFYCLDNSGIKNTETNVSFCDYKGDMISHKMDFLTSFGKIILTVFWACVIIGLILIIWGYSELKKIEK